jgi:uncharacterized secreted protein with C-terminal beta-propeller domain
VTVLTVDPRRGLDPVDRDVVVADAGDVYASPSGLYVSTASWGPADAPASSTAIHRFDIADPVRTRYAGSGRVDGTLLGQWAMSEHDGVLRVASTAEAAWDARGREVRPSEGVVTTLRVRDDALVPLGRLAGLGRGERVVGVRFAGAVGYVVTFRQTDPLWVVDLLDPAAPRVRGALKVPGYSAHLQPVGDGLLLGVGQDADPRGRTLGTKFSLFGVADPARPRELATLRLDGAWSEAEHDHQAILWWAPERLLVVPVTGAESGGSRAVAMRVGADTVTQAGSLGRPARRDGWDPPATRTLVAGGSLVTVWEDGVGAAALDGLAPRGWLPFR